MKKLLYWTPRVLSILYCLFIMLFSFDVFEENTSFINLMIGFIMHNIPVIVMIIITVFAWKRDLVGAIGFTLVGIFFFVLTGSLMMIESGVFNPSVFIVSVPAWIIAFLYGINWFKYKPL